MIWSFFRKFAKGIVPEDYLYLGRRQCGKRAAGNVPGRGVHNG